METNPHLPFLCTIDADWHDGEGFVPEVGAICEASAIQREVTELRAAGCTTRVRYYGGTLDADFLAKYGIHMKEEA